MPRDPFSRSKSRSYEAQETGNVGSAVKEYCPENAVVLMPRIPQDETLKDAGHAKDESEVVEAIILAGGLGTRLRPIVSAAPKAMAEVAGRPFLEYLLGQLRAEGITRAVVCTGYMADAIAGHFGDGEQWGMELRYSVEFEARGTAGALKLAERMLTGDRWLLMNGDSLFDISLQHLINAHATGPALVTIALARVADGHRYGRVTLSPDGMISAFAEKTDAATPGLINGGIYVVERQVLDQIPADRSVSLEREVFPNLVRNSIRGVPFDAYFIDIGVPDDFLRAQIETELLDRLVTR